MQLLWERGSLKSRKPEFWLQLCYRPAVGAQESHFPYAEGHTLDPTHCKSWVSLWSWEKPNLHLWPELCSELPGDLRHICLHTLLISLTCLFLKLHSAPGLFFATPRTSSKLIHRPAKTFHFLLLPSLITFILLSSFSLSQGSSLCNLS